MKDKGYHYLCVSRRRVADYELSPDTKTVTMHDCKNQPISLTQVRHKEDDDYNLEIKHTPIYSSNDAQKAIKRKEHANL